MTDVLAFPQPGNVHIYISTLFVALFCNRMHLRLGRAGDMQGRPGAPQSAPFSTRKSSVLRILSFASAY